MGGWEVGVGVGGGLPPHHAGTCPSSPQLLYAITHSSRNLTYYQISPTCYHRRQTSIQARPSEHLDKTGDQRRHT